MHLKFICQPQKWCKSALRNSEGRGERQTTLLFFSHGKFSNGSTLITTALQAYGITSMLNMLLRAQTTVVAYISCYFYVYHFNVKGPWNFSHFFFLSAPLLDDKHAVSELVIQFLILRVWFYKYWDQMQSRNKVSVNIILSLCKICVSTLFTLFFCAHILQAK